MWKVKTKVIPVILEPLGIVTLKLASEKCLQQIPGIISEISIQNGALLIEKILRRTVKFLWWSNRT